MPESTDFTSFLTTQSTDIPLFGFEVNLILAAILSYALGRLYVRYGLALSNRELFANNFVLLATITMIVITIVKSSLALSLGLVGALSIVRFRAAIKEPEELSYLFFAICIGLGLGADQTVIVLLGFVTISFVIWLRHRNHIAKELDKTLYVTIGQDSKDQLSLSQIQEVLLDGCEFIDLKRYDDNENSQEITYVISIRDSNELQLIKEKLKALNSSIEITFMDQSGVFN